MKILAVAYACNPTMGSESGVGWGWVRMISENCDLHVITAERNRLDIEAYQRAHDDSLAAVSFHYIEHKYSRALDRVFPPYYLATYNHWLKKAYEVALSLNGEMFQLCHLITYVGFRHPGPFHKLEMPFVWGPVGGLENTPWNVLSAMGIRGAIYYMLRNMVNSMDKRFLPGPRAAFRKASESRTVIAATSAIRREIREWYSVESKVICEVGPPDFVSESRSKRSGSEERLRISWSGAHVSGKALPLLLEALKQMPAEADWRLDILGDGPCRNSWSSLAEGMGLGGCCTWHGRKLRDEAMEIMAGSHVFVITSLKDLTSSVLLEALAMGVPVICLDHCGFSDVVDESCGIKVPVAGREKMVAGFRDALVALMKDEVKRQSLSEGALTRAGEYSWDNKRIELAKIYAQAVKG